MTEKTSSGPDFLFTRHSKATYKTYAEILRSNNPEQLVDPETQITPDLEEEGRVLAGEQAETLFTTLDPTSDNLFFISSNEVRALETAKIYRDIARRRGFSVLRPEKNPGEHRVPKNIRDKDIKIIRSLSLISQTAQNAFVGAVFNPFISLDDINWSGVKEGRRRKWEKAREIIEKDNKGSFGANFFHHSKEIKKIFPEVETSKELHETQFKNLAKIIKFLVEKNQKKNPDKPAKILAFGHENYLGFMLDRYFGEHTIGNCETISARVTDEGKLFFEKDGVEKEIKD